MGVSWGGKGSKSPHSPALPPLRFSLFSSALSPLYCFPRVLRERLKVSWGKGERSSTSFYLHSNLTRVRAAMSRPEYFVIGKDRSADLRTAIPMSREREVSNLYQTGFLAKSPFSPRGWNLFFLLCPVYLEGSFYLRAIFIPRLSLFIEISPSQNKLPC